MVIIHGDYNELYGVKQLGKSYLCCIHTQERSQILVRIDEIKVECARNILGRFRIGGQQKILQPNNHECSVNRVSKLETRKYDCG